MNQEITNRTEADAQVQANVDKEVSDRKEADTALEAKLKEYHHHYMRLKKTDLTYQQRKYSMQELILDVI